MFRKRSWSLDLYPTHRREDTYPLLLVMLEHPDAVLDDEEQVDAPQGDQPLQHGIILLQELLGVVPMGMAVPVRVLMAVVMATLRLLDREETTDMTPDFDHNIYRHRKTIL